jgi:aspartate ammonia-lyase
VSLRSDDLNLHQSTTTPTHGAALGRDLALHRLEDRLVALQEAFQTLEQRFAHVVKVARTEMQDAVLTTLGREMGAYAEAVGRDRWRIYKCEERLRVVNLGGTAVGTGLAAPRRYIFRVVDTLRDITGIGFARAENLVDATQNADVFVEVSGMLKACAATLLKISGDLRLLSSGPEAGLGEIRLPQRQMGSSMMPGKVNPVIPEAVSQAAMMVMGYDQTIAAACGAGSLDLNPFLPLIADCLLESIITLTQGCDVLRRLCVEGIEADEARCRRHVESSTAVATALLPALGFQRTLKVVARARETARSIKETILEDGVLRAESSKDCSRPRPSLGWACPTHPLSVWRTDGYQRHPSRHAPAHCLLRQTQCGQVELAERHHAPGCVDRVRSRGHDHRPGGEAHGAPASWSCAVHRHRRHR